MDKTEHRIDFTDSNDFIELTDKQWHFISISSDGNSAIIGIDGDVLTEKENSK